MGPIESKTEDDFDSVMNINFKGAYFTLSRFIPLLNDGASVVILSSIVAATYKPNSSVYQASKAALNSIAKTAAAELAPRKIRVNIVSPGPTKTDFQRRAKIAESRLFKKPRSMTSMDVAKAGYEGLMKGQLIVVPGFSNKVIRVAAKIAPRKMLARLAGKMNRDR